MDRKYFANANRYTITIPRRPMGGQVVLRPTGKGKDVVEGEYYDGSAFTSGNRPLLVKLADVPSPDRIAFSQSDAMARSKPTFDVAPAAAEEEPDLGNDETGNDSQPGEVLAGAEEPVLVDDTAPDLGSPETQPEAAEPAPETAPVETPDDPPTEATIEKTPDMILQEKLAAWSDVHGPANKSNLKKVNAAAVRELAVILGLQPSEDDSKAAIIESIFA